MAVRLVGVLGWASGVTALALVPRKRKSVQLAVTALPLDVTVRLPARPAEASSVWRAE